MEHVAIVAAGLGKKYSISAQGSMSHYRYQRLTDAIIEAATYPMRLLRGAARSSKNDFLWALRDVTFSIAEGEAIGLIGANGAGKSTLLKILSRITEPTTGKAVIYGRVGSLLEVGTGFHPELTGRENTYLSGAVLGMRRQDIARKFDEIVAFAEVERFIDMPVKRYSTGMYLRLAFSVAAHLEPDILLVDEVLAVGDASFQKKSLGRMEGVVGEGRTVVLVSHSMPTISSLTRRCLWLDKGRLLEDGPTAEVVRKYITHVAKSMGEGAGCVSLRDHPRIAPHQHAREVELDLICLRNRQGQITSGFFESEPVHLEVRVTAHRPADLLEIRAYVKSIDGTWLFSVPSGKREVSLGVGSHTIRTQFDPCFLRPGKYFITLMLGTGIPQDAIEAAAHFEVEHNPAGYDDVVWRATSFGAMKFDYRWDDWLRADNEDAHTAGLG